MSFFIRSFLFLALCLLFFQCGRDKIAVENFEEAEKILNNEMPMYTFREVSTSYTEDTKKVMQIKSPLQYRYENGNERFPEGISLVRYNKKEEKRTTLRADSAYYNFQKDIYKVMGNVVVVNLEKKQTLETQELNWDKKTEEIFTETDVKITDEYQTIEGKGMRANQDFSQYSLSEVTGTVQLQQ